MNKNKISTLRCFTKDTMTTMLIVADDEDLARERKEHQCGSIAENRFVHNLFELNFPAYKGPNYQIAFPLLGNKACIG